MGGWGPFDSATTFFDQNIFMGLIEFDPSIFIESHAVTLRAVAVRLRESNAARLACDAASSAAAPASVVLRRLLMPPSSLPPGGHAAAAVAGSGTMPVRTFLPQPRQPRIRHCGNLTRELTASYSLTRHHLKWCSTFGSSFSVPTRT